MLIFYINDSKVQNCPHAKVHLGKEEVYGILDSDAQISVLSEEVCDRFISQGLNKVGIAIQNEVLISTSGNGIRRFKVAGPF
jgi:hypothetical protein